jgi:hypothetical protein
MKMEKEVKVKELGAVRVFVQTCRFLYWETYNFSEVHHFMNQGYNLTLLA